MTTSSTLTDQFDANRIIDTSRLDFLNSIGIDPEFRDACEAMFIDCKAKISEVVALKPELHAANEQVLTGYKNMRHKRKAKSYESFIKHAA